MKVTYDGRKPRTRGLRLVPGVNEIPDANAADLIARGIVRPVRERKERKKSREPEPDTETEARREEEGS